MKNQVTVALFGGLGNQLFQYATGLAVARRHESELVLDLSWFELVHHLPNTTVRKFALDPFGTQNKTISKAIPNPSAAKIFLLRIWRKVQRDLNINLDFWRAGPQVVNENGFRYDQQIFSVAPPLLLNGYWQSPRYFESIQSELQQLFGTPHSMNAASEALQKRIASTDAICLHVRRGDYITNQHAASTHGLCDMDYYHRGIAIAREGLTNPHAYLFSDDPEWVRTNLILDIPITVVDVNGPDDAHQDLWLMAACRHFVIANSSLSWWGAYLAAHPAKRVIAPRRWNIDERLDTSDLIPAGWTRI